MYPYQYEIKQIEEEYQAGRMPLAKAKARVKRIMMAVLEHNQP